MFNYSGNPIELLVTLTLILNEITVMNAVTPITSGINID